MTTPIIENRPIPIRKMKTQSSNHKLNRPVWTVRPSSVGRVCAAHCFRFFVNSPYETDAINYDQVSV